MPYHRYHVYLLASETRRIYIGLTRRLAARLSEHRDGVLPGYTRTYHIERLVHCEQFTDIRDALAREKQLSGGHAGGRSSCSMRRIRAGTI